MKNVRPYKTPLTDIERLSRKVKAYRLSNGPFDYTTRTQAMNDARDFFHEVVREGRHCRMDPEAITVIESARRLYHAAWEAAYPADFWEDYQKLRAGNPTGLESAVRFLEADPIFYRSGYVKDRLMRCIKPPMLKPGDITRLQNVVLSLVDRRDDRDFRAFCRLAKKVDAPELREQLTHRLTHNDPNVKRRAQWVLEALTQKDRMEKSS